MGNQNNVTGPNGGIPSYNSGGNFSNITVNENLQITPSPLAALLGLSTNTAGTTSTVVLYDGQSAPVTITIAAPGVFTVAEGLAALGLVAGSAVKLTTTGALPSGLTSNTTVYVTQDTNLTATTFAVSDTQAHALAGTNQVTTTGSQSGTQTVWNVTNVIGTFTTTAQAFVPIPAALSLGLIAITAGGSAANITLFYV